MQNAVEIPAQIQPQSQQPADESQARRITLEFGGPFAVFGSRFHPIYVGIGMKSGATAMNHFRHSCEKFILMIYHVLHQVQGGYSINCQW